MKFSISFKYSNVTFKNKETKETISYDTKAETGNTFTFDNVDEDVVLGIVKGIKDKKASQVFSYDDFRTNFINVMARNKCKELYDKLDKGGWKVEDIAISNITIKDLEFTKPTMNAREVITVESKNKKTDISGIVCINWEWSSEYGDTESGEERIPVFGTTDETIKKAVLRFCSKKPEWAEVGGHCDNVYLEVFLTDHDTNEKEFLFDGSFENGEIEWFANNGKGEHKYTNESKEEVEIEFKKTPDDGTVIAFFPQTMHDGSCNPGNIMSYEHNGQHGEASIDFYHDCTNCFEEDYAALLHELEGIYDDCELVVVQK